MFDLSTIERLNNQAVTDQAERVVANQAETKWLADWDATHRVSAEREAA